MDESLLATLALGFTLGLRHALDADHVVAVSTIVGRERSIARAAAIGAIWGLGHTATLFAAAAAVIALQLTISPRFAATTEGVVGLMLIVLGADLLVRVLRGELRVHAHPHAHDGASGLHVHLHVHAGHAETHGHHGAGTRSFLVGIVHGLAGSAALMLVVLGTIEGVWAGLLYVLVFGVGTIVGMLVVAAAVALPLALASRLLTRLVLPLQVAVGLGSIGFGVFYTWRVVAAADLFGLLRP